MNFEAFISKLSLELKNPLPGEAFQKKMSPEVRFNSIKKEKPDLAGVFILLFYEDNEIKLVFTKRRSYKGVHSGQISLPGGKMEKKDASDLLNTALRETEEEIGVNRNSILPIGTLSQIYIGPSNCNVQPYIGYVKDVPEFKTDPVEVEYLIKVKLSFLCLNETIESKNMNILEQNIIVPYYNINNEHIWGATAMIISEFIEIINRVKLFF